MSWRVRLRLFGLALVVVGLGGCYLRDAYRSSLRPPSSVEPREYVVVTTGYCPCSECCGWTRNWWGRPTYASGPLRGKAKKVGQTASGAMAKPGTIAADTSIFPFGTVMYVPGYGYGRVEDRGGDIKGYHIDLFYRTHSAALQHGRYREGVKVWLPEDLRGGKIPGTR
ncbi:MAG: 3D domain-containing protein [Kiritimatiellae bacterium]|nr:3D domain-containing protein [Kiritimatiellia bacterium]MCO5068761.1 3D domain-containing protein [Kiritimatiellia bacterium]